nr:DUF898 family protein [Methylobacterium sp. GC_Met_2]
MSIPGRCARLRRRRESVACRGQDGRSDWGRGRRDDARRRGDLRLDGLTGIVVKGFLLSLLTSGLYRFWYISNLQRFLWSRTVVDGSTALYVGGGQELFLGFLVAIVVLVQAYVGLFAVSLLFPNVAEVSALLSVVVLFVLGQLALCRCRRYRVSRTLWRGIRLGQDGSGLAYAARASGWCILVFATATRGLIRNSGFAFVRGYLTGDVTGSAVVVALGRTVSSARHSREAERAADGYAVAALARAGGDGAAVATILERIAADSGGDPAYLRTHPFTRDRAAVMRLLATAPSGARAPLLDSPDWTALKAICGPMPAR